MVSIMNDMQASNEPTACSNVVICDNPLSVTASSPHSPISQNEINIQITNDTNQKQLIKKSLRLDLESTRYEIIHADNDSISESLDSQEKNDDIPFSPKSPKSPKSPRTGEL
jgi:hypothetical protein